MLNVGNLHLHFPLLGYENTLIVDENFNFTFFFFSLEFSRILL